MKMENMLQRFVSPSYLNLLDKMNIANKNMSLLLA